MYRAGGSESSSTARGGLVSPGVAMRYSAGAAASARGAVKWLGICFLFLFSGFQAAQGLQSSLNTELGLVNLAVLYSVFALSLLEAPRLIGALERRFNGLPWVLALGGLSFVLAIAVNLLRPSWEASWRLAVYVASFALLGLGAATLWTAQAEYLGRCAVSATRRSGVVSAATTELNALFFSFFQFSGFLGCGIVAYLFSYGESREKLFLILAVISSVGVAAFLGLPKQEFFPFLGSPAPRTHGGAREVLRISGQPEFVRLAVLIFTNGMMLGFFFGPLMEAVVTTTLGPQWVARVLMTFFFVNSASTRVWGFLRTRSSDGSLALASAVVTGVLLVLLLHKFPVNFVLDEQTGEWVQVAEELELENCGIQILVLVAAFAFGDAYFESQLPAAVQGEFQTSSESLEANAAYKFWQTLGTATQLVLALTVEVDKQLVVLGSFLVLGVWSSRYRSTATASDARERLVEEEESSIQV